jgi:hypothetical protein
VKKTILIFVILLCTFTLAQKPNYNLTGLTSVKVELLDQNGILDFTTAQKIITETKLKLISAGLTITETDPIAAFQIKVDVNRSVGFADPRILLRLELLEKVQTFRKGKIRTDSKTYSYSQLFSCPVLEVNKTVYDVYMNSFLIGFIETWFYFNKK